MKRRHLGERLSALIDGELSDAGRERVLAHLAKCADCRREAASLRLLKRRMYTLGDAAADDQLTWRLLALAPDGGQRASRRWPAGDRWPARPRRRRTAPLVAAGVAVAGLGLSSAAFVAGGARPPSGPKIVPAVDVFMVQHAITTGQVPVGPAGVPSAGASSGAP